jgi:hypothetical protein
LIEIKDGCGRVERLEGDEMIRAGAATIGGGDTV